MPPDWSDEYSRGDRVRAVAETLSEPRTANWIANETGVAHETVMKYLTQLVEENRLVELEQGPTTMYYPDRVNQYLEEIHDLFTTHSADELTDGLIEMEDQIREWRETFDAETPNELRSSISEETLDVADQRHRQQIANEWEQLDYRIQLIEDTGIR
jgi:DNA-binding transcriptional ArsR family regulator